MAILDVERQCGESAEPKAHIRNTKFNQHDQYDKDLKNIEVQTKQMSLRNQNDLLLLVDTQALGICKVGRRLERRLILV